jgi:hypothetical protein
MEIHSAPRPARFRRRIVAVIGLVPNSPTHRRDTIECRLECGHTRCILRVNRDDTPSGKQCHELIGVELQCAKCFVAERINRKNGQRRGRRVPASSHEPRWSRFALPRE